MRSIPGPNEVEINISIKDLGLDSELAKDRAKIVSAFKGIEIPIKLDVSNAAMLRALHNNFDMVSHDLNILRQGSDATQRRMSDNFDMISHDLIMLRGNMTSLRGNVRALGDESIRTGRGIGDLDGNVRQLSRSAGFAGGRLYNLFGLFGALNRQVNLLGKLGGLKIPFISEIGALHLVLDSFTELIAVLIPATLAATAFGIAGADAAMKFAKRLQSTQNTVEALGKSIYPIKGSFQELQDAVKPQVWVLYGEGLEIASRNTGAFREVALEAGHVLDKLGARITYALTVGKGFGVIMRSAGEDLAGLTDVFGNLFGTVGYVLKAVPGYAEILLHFVDAGSKAVEWAVGASEPLLKAGLAFHGAAVWIGVAGGILAKITTRGLGAVGTIFARSASALGSLGKVGAIAGTQLAGLAIQADRTAKLPWGWIAAAAMGFGLLVYKLYTAKDAIQGFYDNEQKLLDQMPAMKGYQQAQIGISEATASVLQAQSGLAAKVNATKRAIDQGGVSARALIDVYQDNRRAVNENQQGLDSLKNTQQTYNKNLQYLSDRLGGAKTAQNLLTQAGITYGEMTKKNRKDIEQVLIVLKGYDSALRAMALGTGRTAAAQNAMNISLGTGSTKLAEYLDAAEKMVQAEDQVTNIVLGSEQAFYAFAIALNQTGLKAYSAKDGFEAMTKQGKLLKDFYTAAMPAAQKLIDSLQMQDISTKDLTTVIASQAKAMLPLIGNNKAAKAVIIDLINNALGPGTTDFKNLKGWTDKYGSSLNEANRIVDKATVKIGGLSGVMLDESNILKNRVNGAIRAYANELLNAHYKTGIMSDAAVTAGKSIVDLGKHMGWTRGKTIDMIQKLLDIPHNIAVKIYEEATGKGKYTINDTTYTRGSATVHRHTTGAKGMKVPGVGNNDTVPAMLTPGEVVVPKGMVQAGAVDHLKGSIPGFAQGGVVGNPYSALGQWSVDRHKEYLSRYTHSFEKSFLHAIQNALRNAIRNSVTSGGLGFAPAGAGTGPPMAYAQSLFPFYGWSSAQWPPLRALWMGESGWRWNAQNASSGAYGIPQSLPASKMASAGADYLTNYKTQIRWGEGYIHGTYGTPANAYSFWLSQSPHWYDSGGPITETIYGVGKSGRRYGFRAGEHVTPQGGTTIRIVFDVTGTDRSLKNWIRNVVRVEGGGDVQTAFGRNT